MLPPDWNAVAVWRNRADFPAFAATLANPRVEAVRCDLSDAAAVAELAARAGELDALLVLAANGDPVRSVSDPGADLTETTVTALHTFQAFRARRLVYFSSGAVYEGLAGAVDPSSAIRPRLPYAVSHRAAECYADYFVERGHFDHAVALRFFGAFGPHEPPRKIYSRLIWRFAFERAKDMTLKGDGRNIIDAMYVDDAVQALLRVFSAPAARGFEIVDLPGGNPMTIAELAQRVARACGAGEIALRYAGAVAEDHGFRASMRGFTERFGPLELTPLEEGIARLRRWLEAHPTPTQ